MPDLLRALREFDGKTTSVLLDIRARFGAGDGFLADLATLIACPDGAVSDGATWLIKNSAENGVVPGGSARAAIIARLDGVTRWQAALHLCQTVEFLDLTSDEARRFATWAAEFLDHERPFLRAWSMAAFQHAAQRAPDLADPAEAALRRAEGDASASVRARARKMRALKS